MCLSASTRWMEISSKSLKKLQLLKLISDRLWFQKCLIFTPLNVFILTDIFSNGLKPPTSLSHDEIFIHGPGGGVAIVLNSSKHQPLLNRSKSWKFFWAIQNARDSLGEISKKLGSSGKWRIETQHFDSSWLTTGYLFLISNLLGKYFLGRWSFYWCFSHGLQPTPRSGFKKEQHGKYRAIFIPIYWAFKYYVICMHHGPTISYAI